MAQWAQSNLRFLSIVTHRPIEDNGAETGVQIPVIRCLTPADQVRDIWLEANDLPRIIEDAAKVLMRMLREQQQ